MPQPEVPRSHPPHLFLDVDEASHQNGNHEETHQHIRDGRIVAHSIAAPHVVRRACDGCVCVCDKSKGLETRLTRVSVRSVREIASSQYTFTHGVRSVVEQLLRAAVIHHSTIRTHLQSMGCGDGVKIIVWLRDGDG